MAQMTLSTKQKQTHTHREETCGCQGGEGREGSRGRWMETGVEDPEGTLGVKARESRFLIDGTPE